MTPTDAALIGFVTGAPYSVCERYEGRKMKNKYAKLDEKIIAAVKSGVNKFSGIEHLLTNDVSNFRELDRRLQALRKKGVLKYDRATGWVA